MMYGMIFMCLAYLSSNHCLIERDLTTEPTMAVGSMAVVSQMGFVGREHFSDHVILVEDEETVDEREDPDDDNGYSQRRSFEDAERVYRGYDNDLADQMRRDRDMLRSLNPPPRGNYDRQYVAPRAAPSAPRPQNRCPACGCGCAK